MATTVLLLELAVVLAMIFIGARMGGIGLGIFGMLGVFVLVYGFGLKPGSAPIDVMMIILAVVTAAAALQAAGGLEYLVGQAAIFLRKHPHHITYYGPLCTWLFCLVAGTAHTCYSLLPIISEIAQANKIRPERPLSLAVISASLGITGSPVSAATAAIISQDLLGGAGVELGTILMVCVPASLVAILVAAFIQNRVGKALEDDPEYQRRVREGLICPEKDTESLRQAETMARPEAKYSVWVFLFGVALVVLFGFQPQLRPEGVTMSETIEMIMMADVILIMLVGKVKVGDVTKGSVFAAGINAVIAEQNVYRAYADGDAAAFHACGSELFALRGGERGSVPQNGDRVAVRSLGQRAIFKEVHLRRTNKARDKQIGRMVEDLLRRADLLDKAVAHDDDAVAERHRFDLIVRDVDKRGVDLFTQLNDLRAHLVAKLGVEV